MIASVCTCGVGPPHIILGGASWNNADRSVKYAWRDSRGHRARGGEVPIGVVPQMVQMLVQHGYVDAADLLRAITDGLQQRPQL